MRERILALRPLAYEAMGDPATVRWLLTPGVSLSAEVDADAGPPRGRRDGS